jgi:predicted solute-binding protein
MSHRGDLPVRVCAVSFLNTVPLVRGLTHGPQRGSFDLSFSIPSACADRLETGEVDIGLVPCGELDRLKLSFFPETGIACRGPVRSILLICKVPPSGIRTLAADTSSRSSVMLSRIILGEKFGVQPELLPMRPDLENMLRAADAALIIGDPALRIDPASVPYEVLDLGGEWFDLTGLPMVFAVWAGAREHITPASAKVFLDSARFGLANLDSIVAEAPVSHGVAADLARVYLTRHIVFELTETDLRGLDLYRRKVAEIRAGDLIPACYSK